MANQPIQTTSLSNRKMFFWGLFGALLASIVTIFFVFVATALTMIMGAIGGESMSLFLTPLIQGLVIFFLTIKACAWFSADVNYRRGLKWGWYIAVPLIIIEAFFFSLFQKPIDNLSVIKEVGRSGDEAACSQISESGIMGVQHAECLSTLAEKKKDIAFCDAINPSKAGKYTDQVSEVKSSCYLAIARVTINPAICKSTNQRFDFCLSEVAKEANFTLQLKKPVLCHGVKNESMRFDCYNSIVLKGAHDSSLYKRFCPFMEAIHPNGSASRRCVELGGSDVIKDNNEYQDELINRELNFEKAFAELSK